MDVLGFADIVQRADSKLARLAYQTHTAGMLAEVAAGLGSRVSRNDGTPVRVHMQRFSDTFLLFTDIDKPEDLEAIVAATSAMLSGQILNGFLLRGAIVKGDLYVHNDLSVVIGSGIVEASEQERRQEWGGAILVQKGLNSTMERQMIAYLKDRGWLMEWEVPIKQRKPEMNLAVGWSFWLPNAKEFLRAEIEKVTPATEARHQAMQQATWEFYTAHLKQFPEPPSPSQEEMTPEEIERFTAQKNLIARGSKKVKALSNEKAMTPVELYFLVLYPNSTALTGQLENLDARSGGD